SIVAKFFHRVLPRACRKNPNVRGNRLPTIGCTTAQVTNSFPVSGFLLFLRRKLSYRDGYRMIHFDHESKSRLQVEISSGITAAQKVLLAAAYEYFGEHQSTPPSC